MADTRPRRNLPPVAEPWGRSVDSDLRAFEQTLSRQNDDITNSFKMVNSTMKTFAQQIQALNELTAELASTQAALAAQQAALTAQQTALAGQQSSLNSAFAQLSAVAANEVTGASAANSNGSPITVGNGGNYVGASVVVPSGFTRAIVTAQSSIRIVGGANMALYLAVNINGNVGGTFPVFGDSGSSVTTAASANHGATLGGLTAGQTLTIYGRTTSVSGVSGAYFSNAASFIFLK